MKIGVIIPLAENEQMQRALSFGEIRARAEQIEAEGFDSLWLYDHILHRFPNHPTAGMWECWTMLSALAAVTERVELGTHVLCTAFRNPMLLAKMATTLEEVSGGRLVLGLGAGWHQPEFDAMGLPFDHLAARFEEAVQIVTPLMREGRVEFQGAYARAHDAEMLPRGPRPHGPPIMIAAFGPRMLRIAARHADLWTTDWLGPAEAPEPLRRQRADLVAACQAVGRDPAGIAITGGVTVAFPDLGPVPVWLKSPDQYLTGTPDALAEGLRRYAAEGVAHVMCAVYPHIPAALARLGEATRSLR